MEHFVNSLDVSQKVAHNSTIDKQQGLPLKDTKMDSEYFGTMVFAGILGVVALGIGLGFILSIIL